MIDARSPASKPFFYKGGPVGTLLIHGFTGTCGQMRLLGDALRDAGYTVAAPLLPGHGTTLEDMNQSTGDQWLQCVREAYTSLQKQVDKIAVIGLSMGGTLATLLAEEYMPDGYVGISAAIRVQAKLAPLAGILWPFRPYLRWGSVPLAKEGYANEVDAGYDGLPVRKMVDLNRLRARARRNLALITCPALIIQPVHDETVDPVSAKIIYSGIQSQQKKLVELEHSPHVCTLGPERDIVHREVLEFLSQL